jgi:hypothetical protein
LPPNATSQECHEAERKSVERRGSAAGRDDAGSGAGGCIARRWLRRAGPWIGIAAVLGMAGGWVPEMRAQQAVTASVASAELPDAPGVSADSEQESSAKQATGNISGVVVDPSGAAVAGARVTLSADGSSEAKQTVADGDGKFDFAGVAPGAFKIAIASDGYAVRNISGTLLSGQSLQLSGVTLEIAATANDVRVSVPQDEVAQLEVKEQEQQRVLGFIPNFYVSYAPNPVPLSPKLKFELAWKSVIDPVTFAITGVVAGVEQANNTFPGYGQGASGYAKRYGAGYADAFIGTMIGSAILPSVLKQDPRYFYKGTGTVRSRALYAIANAVICKGDNGHWQANYSAILGGLAAAGISNLYYPASSRNGAGLTFENAAIGTAATAAANLLQEFLVRKLTPKIPKYASP